MALESRGGTGIFQQDCLKKTFSKSSMKIGLSEFLASCLLDLTKIVTMKGNGLKSTTLQES